MNKKSQTNTHEFFPTEEEMKAALLACCGRYCNACETPAEYAWRKREVDMALLLEKAISEELTKTEREIITDFWFNSESVTQIAKKRGIKPPSVNGTLARAQKKLEKALRYAVCYSRDSMSQSIIPAVFGRAKVIAAARNASGGDTGIRLTRLRQSQCLSVEKLEKAIGISASRLEKLEKGTRPNVDELILLSEFFDVTTDFILKGATND